MPLASIEAARVCCVEHGPRARGNSERIVRCRRTPTTSASASVEEEQARHFYDVRNQTHRNPAHPHRILPQERHKKGASDPTNGDAEHTARFGRFLFASTGTSHLAAFDRKDFRAKPDLRLEATRRKRAGWLECLSPHEPAKRHNEPERNVWKAALPQP